VKLIKYFSSGLLGTALPRTTTLDFSFFQVWDTVKALPADRAPGPDGFIGRFYKACWQIIISDFMATIITLQHGDDRKLWLLNSAYLTLIAKEEEALTAKDFRPISLVHSFAKLVTKIMATGWPLPWFLWCLPIKARLSVVAAFMTTTF